MLGNKLQTLNDKKRTLDQFKQWCQKRNESPEEMKHMTKEVHFLVIQYLEGYRVKEKTSGEMVRPKGNYLLKMKSMLTSELTQLTGK